MKIEALLLALVAAAPATVQESLPASDEPAQDVPASVPADADAADVDPDTAAVVSGPLPQEEDGEPQPPAPLPFEGRFAHGYEVALERYEAGDLESVRRFGARLLLAPKAERWRELADGTRWAGVADRLAAGAARFGWESRSSVQLAHVHHLMACAERKASNFEEAEAHLASARALAGPGDLRLDAIADLGWIDLTRAEELFDKIPEVHGGSNNAMSPGFVPHDEEEEDALEPAKRAYLEARDHYRERLLLDWQDADVRANVELIQRRLETIADIEDERRQDEGQERSDDQEPENDDNGESQDSSPNGQQSPAEQQDGEPNPDQEQQDQEGENQDSEDAESEESEEGESDEPQDDAAQETHLTKEEMQRLLEQLKEHGDRGDEIRRMNHGRRIERVEKDW